MSIMKIIGGDGKVMEEVISNRSFSPDDLAIEGRKPGISAFMRIRNGEDFLEVAVRSHIDLFDEIVAVYNQCTDRTPEILSRLAYEFGANRLRVFHYTDRVFPPGSEGHEKTPPESPNSLVNYYNMALAQTRFSHAVKLDDDHLAIPNELYRVVRRVRGKLFPPDAMLCFSGLNLIRAPTGHLGVYPGDPVSGSGDIGFFPVTGKTIFFHDRRFERFSSGGLRRKFVGFLYWHLKYLKKGSGFANYELDANPGSRYHKRLTMLRHNLGTLEDTEAVHNYLKTGPLRRFIACFSEKERLTIQRNLSVLTTFGNSSIEEALAGSVEKEFLSYPGIW